MKKLILMSLLILAVFSGIVFVQNGSEESQVEAVPQSIEEKIEQFILANEDQQVQSIEIKVKLNKEYEAILFVQKNNNIGCAIVKNEKIITVHYGDNKQSEDQFKNFFIVYGEKSNPSNMKLTATIDLGNNEKELEQSFTLQDGKYYLSFAKLPKGSQFAKVLGEYEFE
ncbi:hypothetical protein [Neobacillus mesonae]|uniref:hypothetical protein n=1 Tax=Neobacillus mesonae TaxID=1193713 RepID=UPI002E1BE1D2|nr:hypothetical protein [Neobacillus mesonae]